MDRFHLQPGDTVLDLACGTGLNLPFLARKVGPEGRVICLDLSESMLELARRRARENQWHNVLFVHDDAQTFRLEPLGISRVDGIIITYAVPLIANHVHAIVNAIGYLKDGGRLVTTSYCPPKGEFKKQLFRIIHRFYTMRGHLTAMDFERKPWTTMQEHMKTVRVESRFFGFRYLAWGEK